MNAPNFIHMRDCSVGGGSAANEADRTVVLTTATSEDYIRECNELSYGVKRYLRMPCTHVTLPPALAPSAKAFTRLEPLLPRLGGTVAAGGRVLRETPIGVAASAYTEDARTANVT